MRLKQVVHIAFIAVLLFSINRPVLGSTTDTELTITYRMTRNFGMGLGPYIQGTFTILVTGPEDLVRVEFYLDDVLMKNDTDSPFSWQFNSDSFGSGVHEFKIIGYSPTNQGSVTFSKNVVSLLTTLVLVFTIVAVVFAIKYVIIPAIMKKRT